MSLLDRIKNLIHTDRIASWPLDDRAALFRLLYLACTADEAYTADEQTWLQGTMKDAGLTWEQLHSVEVPVAIRLLLSDPAKEERLYALLAEALFADGDFDRAEKAFVARLTGQGLSGNKLDAAIKHVRDRVLGDALSDWNQDIEEGKTSAGS